MAALLTQCGDADSTLDIQAGIRIRPGCADADPDRGVSTIYAALLPRMSTLLSSNCPVSDSGSIFNAIISGPAPKCKTHMPIAVLLLERVERRESRCLRYSQMPITVLEEVI